jgi:AAA family ATP:ADP antiporter
MRELVSRVFRLRPGEAGLVLTLGFLLVCNSVAEQVSGILAISGFLSEGGVNQILIVWVMDTALVTLATGLQSLVIDRFNRTRLIRWVILGLALVFVALRLLFATEVPGWLGYSITYLVSQQQWLFFPLVFWVLANDVLDMAQTKRLFPIIAGWSFAGRLLGIIITGASPRLFSQLGIRPEEVLTLNVLLYAMAYLVALVGLRKVRVRQTQQKRETVRETLTEGWSFVREVPSFRYLMLSIVALIVCDTIVEFRFLVVSDQVFQDASSYQTFYSLYRLGYTLASIAVQSFLTSRIISRIGLKNVFLIVPFSSLAGVTWMMALPGIVSGVGGVVLRKLPAFTIDESARKAFQALVPEERRGRVSMFMDSYLYAAGTVIGCILTGATLLVGSRLHSSAGFYVYLAFGALATLFAIWAISKMRGVYDSSLFNWRLKRRQRGATVLDKLDF